MRCTRGARRLRRCGLCLFVLMVSGLLSVTMLSFVGILRSVRLLVVGTLMMISSRTTLLHLQTDQTACILGSIRLVAWSVVYRSCEEFVHMCLESAVFVQKMCYDAVWKDEYVFL